ncbi:MAG: aldehyde dehydrogenase family protein [Bacteroidia bacterium]|nr:aldehyde dehydrogenase family protein [Bacteroidia bacterium]
MSVDTKRIAINKTYKMYVDGKFIRSESGRYFKCKTANGNTVNMCRASRKDVRDAVIAMRKAQPAWAKRTAYNKAQILYRIAEVLEGRTEQFMQASTDEGVKPAQARIEIETAIDRLVYYAGWCDKYIQLFSSVNPVESSHFNFTYPEPTGIVALIAPPVAGLLALVSLIAPAIAGGNTVLLMAHSKFPITAVTFTEVLHASDVPAGVVNILTGTMDEVIKQFATHMDINAVVYAGPSDDTLTLLESNAALSVKRISTNYFGNYADANAQNPYLILDLQEFKTTWHPIGL